MKTHKLKIKQEYFDLISSGVKNCECRINDRDYRVGDEIIFFVKWAYKYKPSPVDSQWIDNDYFRQNGKFKITHIQTGEPFGIMNGYCVLSIN